MPSTYSTNLRLELMATGENRNSWGPKVNTDLQLIEAAIAGYESIAMADANVTLTTNNGSADQGRKAMLNFTGVHTAIRTVTIPTVSKAYLLVNSTTGGYGLTISNGSSTVSLAASEKAMVYTDGTTVWKMPWVSYGEQSLSTDEKTNVRDQIGVTAAIAEAAVPTGIVMEYGGSTEPTGWLFCYGQAASRSTYSALFAIIGTTYGAGNGTTTFNLPDLRGRVVAGKDDMGGSSANRLTNQTGGLNGDTLGASGGSETHTMTEAQIAAHTHSFSATSGGVSVGHSHTASLPYAFVGVTAGGSFSAIANSAGAISVTVGEDTPNHTHSVSGTTGSTGSTSAHNNVQPTFILNKIIKT